MRFVALVLAFAAVGCATRKAVTPAEAARITYDRATSTFTLTNVSDQPLWYAAYDEGGAPVVEHEVGLPDCWAWVSGYWCRIDPEFRPRAQLHPGDCVRLGRFFVFQEDKPGVPGYYGARAREFAEKGGDLCCRPQRLSVFVSWNKTGGGTIVYSEGIIPPP